MIFLLDVNVLIALADVNHIHHYKVSRWFEADSSKGWATCPITENALLRILSYSGYPNHVVDCAEAAAVLWMLRRQGRHHFWSDDISMVDDRIFDLAHLASKNSTDTYLLGLAKVHHGRFATLDRRLVTSAVIGGADALHVIA